MTTPTQSTFRIPDNLLLPLTTKAPYIYVPVVQIPVDLTDVDYLDIRADLQYVTSLPYQVMCAEYLATSVDGSYDTTNALISPMGTNFTLDTHYRRATLNRIYIPPAGQTSVVITVVSYAASTAAQPDDTLAVKYLDVQVNVFPKGAA